MTQTCVTLIKSAECNQTAGSSSLSAAGSPVSARLFKEKGERVKKGREKKKMKKEQQGKCIMNLKSVFRVGESKKEKKELLGKRTQPEIEW